MIMNQGYCRNCKKLTMPIYCCGGQNNSTAVMLCESCKAKEMQFWNGLLISSRNALEKNKMYLQTSNVSEKREIMKSIEKIMNNIARDEYELNKFLYAPIY